MYNAFLFDVDGTITESAQVLTQQMAAALSHLPAEIGFCSGTGVAELRRMLSSQLKIRHHLLGNTGTHYVIIDGAEREILKESLSVQQKKEITHALKMLKAHYSLTPITSEEDQIQDRGSQITLSVLGRNAPLLQKKEYDPTTTKRKQMVDFLLSLLPPASYDLKIAGTTSIDITIKGYTKDKAIKLFMLHNDIKPEEIIFFGDQLQPGGNDHEALRAGVRCIQVESPEQTLAMLQEMLRVQPQANKG